MLDAAIFMWYVSATTCANILGGCLSDMYDTCPALTLGRLETTEFCSDGI